MGPSGPPIARGRGVRAFTACVLIAGFALFGWLLTQVEIAAVAQAMSQLGWLGAAALISVFAIGFQADVFSWHLTFQSAALSGRWALRLWLVPTGWQRPNNGGAAGAPDA